MTFQIIKDPQAILPYGFDWSEWLGVDTIATSNWSADTGITIDSDANTTTVTSVTLSGGSARHTYKIVNHIVTAAGLEDDRTITVDVKQR